MAYEILVLDIDGTLTNSKKEISPRTLEAILNVQERGHKVVLASGRPTPGVIPLAQKIKLHEYGGYILSFNGGKITNCKTNEVIYQKVLPHHMIPQIYEAALANSVGLLTYEGDTAIAGTEIDDYMKLETKINGIPLKKVENFPSYITFDVIKCLMTGPAEHLKDVEQIMKSKFRELNIFRSEPFFLEIMPQNIDKAYSLSLLLDHLGLSKEQMISCGDGFNDLSMIQYAGMGVAMANAQTVVKEAADFITLSNDEDGIAHVIKEFML
ncbi:MAG: yidA [Lachnospiraceae bacterium]|jgi:Cof subfamily protein (haloacid dehalogenase superfamily)|nr:yidA [Lachnospiraceae bacterium]